MHTETFKLRALVTACLLAMTSLSSCAADQSTASSRSTGTQSSAAEPATKQAAAAMKHVDDAVAVVRRMETEAGMDKVLQQAKGVFIVPTYGRAALGVGGAGGAGVLLARRGGGTWSDPAFYNIGGINVGLQAGVEAGPIALVLNSEKALNSFMERNNFSLSADAGLTIVDWTKTAQGTTGLGDAVVWAGTKGLFGNVASIGVNDIRFNQGQTNAYYRKDVALKDILGGKVKNPQSAALRQALASRSTGSASGSSGGKASRGMSGEGSGKSDSSK